MDKPWNSVVHHILDNTLSLQQAVALIRHTRYQGIIYRYLVYQGIQQQHTHYLKY